MDDARAPDRATDLGSAVAALGGACDDLAENARDLRTAVDALQQSTDRLRAGQRSVADATDRRADACERDQTTGTQVFVPPAGDTAAAPDPAPVDDVSTASTAGFAGDTQVYVHGD